jgi:precorrin-6B methylase 1
MVESEEHIAFPKIYGFNNFIKEITYKSDHQIIPIISSIKLHGSHADIIVKNGSIICQST